MESHGNSEVMSDGGADVNFVGKDGKTALHVAARRGHWEVTKMLLEHKADASITDDNGNTALHLAQMY